MKPISLTDARFTLRQSRAYEALLEALQFYADGNHLHYLRGASTPCGFELGAIANNAITLAQQILRGEK